MDQATKDYLKKNNLEAVIFGLIIMIIVIVGALWIFTPFLPTPFDKYLENPDVNPQPSESEMRAGRLW